MDSVFHESMLSIPAEKGITEMDDMALSDIDLHFAHLMQRLSGSDAPGIAAAAALVSMFTRQGHTCMDLNMFAGRELSQGNEIMKLMCPGLDEWRALLSSSLVVGRSGEDRPLILDASSRLYLKRYWDYQVLLSQRLTDLSSRDLPLDRGRLKELLGRYFPEQDPDAGPDWQKIAVIMALKGGLCILTGGPGTGKTTVVSKMLALLLELEPGLKIALAAPTGKAGQRMEEALRQTFRVIGNEALTARIPGASTIHRLLGIVPGTSRARYSRKRRLPHDVVVVDEASMTSLSLAARLVEAMKPGARLMLVGDKNQLSSVEPGHVLGDICRARTSEGYSEKTCSLVREVSGYELTHTPVSTLEDCIIELRKSYRFSRSSGIGLLADAVQEGDSLKGLELIRNKAYEDVVFKDLQETEPVRDLLSQSVQEGFHGFLKARSVLERFEYFARYRVLCALRKGPFGVESVNRAIEKLLKAQGLIDPGLHHYHGRPVLITANDYSLKLFNGDVGIVLIDDEDGELKCFFPAKAGGIRKVSPARLPAHETAFAMTVHKSQGSEFSSVLLILAAKDSRVLCRELLYTGITRAMDRLVVASSPAVFSSAVTRRTERSSGLGELLDIRG